MEHKTKELVELEKGVLSSILACMDYYDKTKIIERCKYWTKYCGEELEYGIDCYYSQLVEQYKANGTPLSCLPVSRLQITSY
jgi:hypothetical protein